MRNNASSLSMRAKPLDMFSHGECASDSYRELEAELSHTSRNHRLVIEELHIPGSVDGSGFLKQLPDGMSRNACCVATQSLRPSGRLGYMKRNTDRNAPEISRANDLQILHIFRIIEQKMSDAGCLMNTISGRYECLLVFIHKSCPAREHDDDLKISLVDVPARAGCRCILCSHKVRNNLAFGCGCYSEITILEEVAQSTTLVWRVAWLNMRERCIGQHVSVSK